MSSDRDPKQRTVDFTSGEPMDAPVSGPPKVEHGSPLPLRTTTSSAVMTPSRLRDSTNLDVATLAPSVIQPTAKAAAKSFSPIWRTNGVTISTAQKST